MPPLRILHVLTHSNVTRGGAIQALLLAHGQAQDGHTVRVIANSPPDRPLDSTFEAWRHERVEILPFDLGTNGTGRLAEMLRFRRFLDEAKPDVVHVHRDTALVFTWLATYLRTLPALISQRGTTHVFRSKLIARAHKSPRVHRIVAVAEAVKDALVSYGVDGHKIDVVYGSFDVDRFDPAKADRRKLRAELGLRDDQKLIVQVGELHKKKAPRDFVAAAARVLATRDDCVFALVGKGNQQRKVEKAIARHSVRDGVRMLGFRRDVADVYAAADVAVNCSIGNEGLTGALREALAMECRVVATRTDGNPEIVRHGETGFIVEPRDVEAMARGITTMLDAPELGREMGRRGRQLVLELMSPRVRIARTEQVYRDVLARNRVATASSG
jgi:glycosyltransferase involved in cell wall biosynthesis